MAFAPGTKTIANLHTSFLIGRTYNLQPDKQHHPETLVPFKGCIRKISVNGMTLNFRSKKGASQLLTAIGVGQCAECYKQLSVSFVIDNSNMVGVDGFVKIKEFIQTFIGFYELKNLDVSIVDFGSSAQVRIPSITDKTKEEILSLVNAVQYKGFNEYDAFNGLKKAADFAELRRQSRSIVLITTTKAINEKVVNYVNQLQQQNIDVQVIAVSNGNNGATTYLSKRIYTVPSFDHCISVFVKVRDRACDNSR